ncbi:uncharacterized protein OCT59_026261 [Rhizophagus irregularis]|uniref:uncharacterized protein n=1 Tax=Rhizophagus irregularis TaxID=588596 RepID=UPI00331E4CF7|nr:hypothetical protein OCT59_026261 [Rhizophagus irregularis]
MFHYFFSQQSDFGKTVLLDYFESDILTVGSFLFRFFQISFACGISTSFFSGDFETFLDVKYWQVGLSFFTEYRNFLMWDTSVFFNLDTGVSFLNISGRKILTE